jgi:hypothetical protein
MTTLPILLPNSDSVRVENGSERRKFVLAGLSASLPASVCFNGTAGGSVGLFAQKGMFACSVGG